MVKRATTKSKSKKAELQKQEKQQEAVRNAAALQKRTGEERIMEELFEWFEKNPAQAASTLALVKSGMMDEQQDDTSGEKLPSYMNKMRLLDKVTSMDILSSLPLPALATWLGNLAGSNGKKLGKVEFANVLSFVTHMDPQSAVPCKLKSRLIRKLRSRWEQFGKRGSSFKCDESQTLEDFWKENAYWRIDAEGDTM